MLQLEDEFNQNQATKRLISRTWDAFFARFGRLRPIQHAAIPEIVGGSNVLLTAPTAGGKTEAVAAPICQRILDNRWPGLSVLLITPTRALVNDLHARLEHPLNELQIRLSKKTGDYAFSNADTTQFLVTTPESLESLLTFHSEWLANVRVVAVDEIHLLDGSSRGDQMRVILCRLRRYLASVRNSGSSELQLVAMSATVADPVRLAQRFFGSTAKIVQVHGQRDIDASFVLANDESLADDLVNSLEQYGDIQKILVFVNSRKQVDRLATELKKGRFAKYATLGHHGSLSKEEREAVESKMRTEKLAICVATMTLEVGIDIGDIDMVVCCEPPYSLSSFLQRIGRGCRRLQGKTRVLCVSKSTSDDLIFRALVNQARLQMPSGPAIPFRKSVLVQQSLAYLQQVKKHRRIASQFHQAIADPCGDEPTAKSIDGVLASLKSTGLIDEQNGIYQPAMKGWDFIKSSKIYSNLPPNPVEIDVVNADTGSVIATVESIDINSRGVRIAGRSYEIVQTGTNQVTVRPEGDFKDTPKYTPRVAPFAFDIGASLFHFLNLPSDELVALELGNSLFVFTWLGLVNNTALSEMLKKEQCVTLPRPFAIKYENCQPVLALTKLEQAVASLSDDNPFRDTRFEYKLDLGVYYRFLSPDVQQKCRSDWLDIEYLTAWIGSKNSIRVEEAESQLGLALQKLT